MNLSKYVTVTSAIASEVLEKADVTPSTLLSNRNDTFTAIFNDIPMSEAGDMVSNADNTIRVEMPEPLEYDQPTVEPTLKSEVTFGFVAEPSI